MISQDNILHISTRIAWEQAKLHGSYKTPSLDQQGFIHCSKPDQVLNVANSFYKDVPDLIILWIDPDKLNAKVLYEPGIEDSGELFPHIYGPINLDAILAAYDLVPGYNGVYKEIPGRGKYENE
jgi:uncharacterized protein (DUF952 family)